MKLQGYAAFYKKPAFHVMIWCRSKSNLAISNTHTHARARTHTEYSTVSVIFSLTSLLCRFRRGKNLFQSIRQRREVGMVERRFALSGASSVCESQTVEAPERTKRLSTIPISRLCPMLSSLLSVLALGPTVIPRVYSCLDLGPETGRLQHL